MNFMNKAIFLDRDGTIIKDKLYLSDVSGIEFLQDVDVALKKFLTCGFELIVVTNQSGVGRGYYSESELGIVNNRIKSDLSKLSIPILDFYYCPHYVGSQISKYDVKCNCRKPSPGMIFQAVKEHKIDLSVSYMIGDKDSDVQAGKNAGLKKSFLIDERHNLLYYAELICISSGS